MNINGITSFAKRTDVKQVFSLLSANFLGLPLGIITNILITRYLGPEKFGDYSFIISVFNFAIIILTFGLYYASNRAVLLSKSECHTKNLYGASFVITGFLFVVMSLSIAIYSVISTNVQEKGLTEDLLLSLPIGFVLLWGKCFEEVLPSSNQIGVLSRVRLYPRILNLLFALIVYYCLIKYDFNRVLIVVALYGLSQFIIYFLCSIKLKVAFKDLCVNIKTIFIFNKTYGFNVYLGALFASGFSSLTEILISQFGANNTGVGYFALASTLSMPIFYIPATIATTHYKEFQSKDRISKKLLLVTLLISVLSIIALWVFIPPFVYFFYGDSFSPVIKVNFYVSIGVLLYGVADFINRFLCAKGAGKELRNASFIVGAGVLVSNILLIPTWGEYGAAYAKIIAGIIFVLVELYYYRRVTRKQTVLD